MSHLQLLASLIKTARVRTAWSNNGSYRPRGFAAGRGENPFQQGPQSYTTPTPRTPRMQPSQNTGMSDSAQTAIFGNTKQEAQKQIDPMTGFVKVIGGIFQDPSRLQDPDWLMEQFGGGQQPIGATDNNQLQLEGRRAAADARRRLREARRTGQIQGSEYRDLRRKLRAGNTVYR